MPVDALGDDVEVLGRVQRHDGADLVAELARPHARGVDHGVGADLADIVGCTRRRRRDRAR